MTNEIVVKLDESPPVVLVNGTQVSCDLDVTFHKSGGLKVRRIVLSGVPEEASA